MFSIVVPVHNKLPHLDRMMGSILNQTYQKFEIILIDDASTDGSNEKIKEYDDPRIRLFYRDTPGPGGYAARNLGIKVAKNPWIAFLDADDAWEKHYLEDKYNAILKFPKVELISTKWNRSEDGKIEDVSEFSSISDLYKEFSLLDYFNTYKLVWTTAVVIKKELLQKVNGFPAGKVKRGGDVDTWIRCL